MRIDFLMFDGSTVVLQADQQNFTLARPRSRTDKLTGEVVIELETFNYFSSIEMALTKVLTYKLRTSSATNLKELMSDLAKAKQEITSIWTAEPNV